MKMILFILFTAILTADLIPENIKRYISHIKIVDECTYLTEPHRIEALGIKGKDFEAQKAIRACEKSLKKHPSDPHVQFLLARAYSKGAPDTKNYHLPVSVRLKIPELNGIKPKYDLGYALAKSSCLAGDPGGCGLLGYYYYRGIGIRYNSLKAFLLWQWACSQGNMQACQNLSALIDSGYRYIPKDSRDSFSYSLQACMSGFYPRACEFLSDLMHLKGKGKDRDLITYINYKACEAGFDNGCNSLEEQLKEREHTQSKNSFLQILKASCNNGNAKACEKLGDLYAQKPRNRVNNLMASTFYEAACTYGAERFGCWYAGRYKLSKLDGIVRDTELGLKYLNKACYLGQNSFSCYDLANFYIYTKDEKYRNRDEGLKVMERACKVGNVRAIHQGCDEGIRACCNMKKHLEKTMRSRAR